MFTQPESSSSASAVRPGPAVPSAGEGQGGRPSVMIRTDSSHEGPAWWSLSGSEDEDLARLEAREVRI